MSKAKTLTTKQRLFVDEYIIDFNGTQAAIRAGYSARTAQEQSSRLLSNVMVAEAIDEAIADRRKRLRIDADTVLWKWWQIANADYNELSSIRRVACDMCHFTVETDGSEPVDKTINPDCRNCDGEGMPYVFLADTEKLSATGKLVYQGAENTKFGVKINTLDRMKALDNVARHLGMFKDKVEHTGADGAELFPSIVVRYE
ncbi:terminase small subunit [Psychrobacter celer]|uniref:terminase small subunit n=1 Tax=Psychrobacter celer TaxID=306572 RepID=UPI003FCF3633